MSSVQRAGSDCSVSVSGVKHRRALTLSHCWPLVTVPTQCTGETQETRAPGHKRDAALVIIETPATGSLSLSCNIKCYHILTTSPEKRNEQTTSDIL